MRIIAWSSDVCSSDLVPTQRRETISTLERLQGSRFRWRLRDGAAPLLDRLPEAVARHLRGVADDGHQRPREAALPHPQQHGNAEGRDRVGPYVLIAVGADTLKPQDHMCESLRN